MHVLGRTYAAVRDLQVVKSAGKLQTEKAGVGGSNSVPGHHVSTRGIVAGVVMESIKQGCWVTADHARVEHIIKDPFRQADSKHALPAYLGVNGVRISAVSLMHAVAFPDVAAASSLGPAAPGPITWDSRALASINQTITTTIDHWGGMSSLSAKETEHVIGLIAPTVSIKHRLAEDVADVRTKLIELTSEQIWIFSQLRSVRNALV